MVGVCVCVCVCFVFVCVIDVQLNAFKESIITIFSLQARPGELGQ